MIQIARLEGFFHVARTGGYARAARAFPYPITQPAIHQQVKKLEGELGTRLLERVAKDRMQLTPAGRHLFSFIAPFFDGLPAVVRALESDTYGGRLHIDAANLVLRDLVPGWVRRIKRRVPHAEIQLREFGGTNVDRLRHGEADLLVSYLPLLPPDMEGKRVAVLHGHIVVPRGHRLASRKRVGLKDLHGETFVAYHPELLAGQLQRHALAEAGAIPQQFLTAGTADVLLAMVEAGLGVSALATLSPQGPKGAGLKSLRLPKDRFDFPITAAWRRGAPPNPALEAALATAPT